MAARARIVLELESAGQADAMEAALRPELGRDVPGSIATLVRRAATVELALDAEDGGALRAALNSYLRWVDLALAMHDLARTGGPGGGSAGEPKPSNASPSLPR